MPTATAHRPVSRLGELIEQSGPDPCARARHRSASGRASRRRIRTDPPSPGYRPTRTSDGRHVVVLHLNTHGRHSAASPERVPYVSAPVMACHRSPSTVNQGPRNAAAKSSTATDTLLGEPKLRRASPASGVPVRDAHHLRAHVGRRRAHGSWHPGSRWRVAWRSRTRGSLRTVVGRGRPASQSVVVGGVAHRVEQLGCLVGRQSPLEDR